MKTEAEIREKIEELKAEKDMLDPDSQMGNLMNVGIALNIWVLNWVLREGD